MLRLRKLRLGEFDRRDPIVQSLSHERASTESPKTIAPVVMPVPVSRMPAEGHTHH